MRILQNLRGRLGKFYCHTANSSSSFFWFYFSDGHSHWIHATVSKFQLHPKKHMGNLTDRLNMLQQFWLLFRFLSFYFKQNESSS